jgi:hypothetical protein
MTEKVRARRRIKKFDFTGDSAAIALVSEAQGGPANGVLTLITKSNKRVSEEFLRKASEITVTLSITEYLQRFFGLWGTDAELLARSLGFTTEGMEKAEIERKEDALESNEPPEYPEWDQEPGDKKFEEWIDYKLKSISVMKQLHKAENIEDELLGISEEDYIQFLQDQEVVEKALLKLDSESASAEDEASTKNVDVEKSGEGKTSVVKRKKKESKPMTENVQVIEQEVEVIAKSQFDEIQKAFDAQKEELQKALDLVNELKKEKQEAIAKSRKEQLAEVAGDKAEVLFKACGEATDEIFADVVKALGEMKSQVEKSKMFEEVGASVEEEAVSDESGVAKLIKSKYNKTV